MKSPRNGDGISHSSSDSRFLIGNRLARLDFDSFQRCIWLWLGASGHTHMRFLGRRSRRGTSGPDFVARLGRNGALVAVQIRHWKSPISRRAVDELRGTLLRDDIAAGMIVATSNCSNSAKLAAAEYNGRPIRIIGLDRLADSFAELGLGVKSGEFDDQFFRAIDNLSFGHQKTDPATPARRLPIDLGYPHGDPPSRHSIWWVFLLMAALLLVVSWRLG
jgi:hypothetical protein